MDTISIDVETLTVVIFILYACFLIDIFFLKDDEDEHAKNLGDNPNIAKELVENNPEKDASCKP